MGWSASTTGAADIAPHAAFDLPPAATGSIAGTIRDASGTPVPNARVVASGYADLRGVTDAFGNYAIAGVPSGVYTLVASAAGYDAAAIPSVAVGNGAANATLIRDWAALSGGATIASFSPPDLSSIGCGGEPSGAFDLSSKTGWLSTSATSSKGPTGAKAIIVALPATINVTSFAVDPTAPCSATAGAADAGFTIETSADGVTWALSAQGAFTTRGAPVPIAPAAATANVRYVRFTMLGSQAADTDGKDYMGITGARGVRGAARAAPAASAAASSGGRRHQAAGDHQCAGAQAEAEDDPEERDQVQAPLQRGVHPDRRR